VWRATGVGDQHGDQHDDLHHDPTTPASYVIKRMKISDPKTGDCAKREIYFGSTLLPHPNLVSFVEHFYSPHSADHVWLVYKDSGDSLRNFLYQSTVTSDDNTVIYTPSDLWKKMRSQTQSSLLRDILYQILSGAKHLQESHVVHRDIKPSNVFCKLDATLRPQCVLGDLSSGVDEFSLKNLYSNESPSSSQQTLQYTPPEHRLNLDATPTQISYEAAFDSWSIGVLVLEVLLGTPDVFSVDARTSALLRAHMKKTHASEEEIDQALLLASFADFCIYDPEHATQKMWPSRSHDPLSDTAMVTKNCGVDDFRDALQQRDQTQLGFNSPTSTPLLMLIWQLLAWDPQSRLTPTDALNHPYFSLDFNAPTKDAKPTSTALQAQSFEANVQSEAEYSGVTSFICPVCHKEFDSHHSCHTHITGRKHGKFCDHEFHEDFEFTCLSSHVLLPRDDNSGYCDYQGRRSVIEDFHSIADDGDTKYFGVFDGHNGNLAAKYVAREMYGEMRAAIADAEGDDNESIQKAVRRSFAAVNDNFLANHVDDYSGATATVLLKLAEVGVVVANVGDSRAILCTNRRVIKQLTVDHNPSLEAEKKRIESAGGAVEKVGGTWRVNGKLAVSRSFGDRALRSGGLIIVDPHVVILRDDPSRDDDEEGVERDADYIVMATDGLWDVVENEEAAEMVGMVLEGGGDWQEAAERLTKEAYVRGSKDNIGVSIVRV
jgi:serine/threonine protein phosphatase PrpC/serine/threonine protein kinase